MGRHDRRLRVVRRIVERKLPGHRQPGRSQPRQMVCPDADRAQPAQPGRLRHRDRHASRRHDRRTVPAGPPDRRRILLYLPLAERLRLRNAHQGLLRSQRVGARRREHGRTQHLRHGSLGHIARCGLHLVRHGGFGPRPAPTANSSIRTTRRTTSRRTRHLRCWRNRGSGHTEGTVRSPGAHPAKRNGKPIRAIGLLFQN